MTKINLSRQFLTNTQAVLIMQFCIGAAGGLALAYVNVLLLAHYKITWIPFIFLVQSVLEILGIMLIGPLFFAKNPLRGATVFHWLCITVLLLFSLLLQFNWFFVPLFYSSFLLLMSLLFGITSWTNSRIAFNIIDFKKISNYLSISNLSGPIVFGFITSAMVTKFGVNVFSYIMVFLILVANFSLSQIRPLVITENKQISTNQESLKQYHLYHYFFLYTFLLVFCYTAIDFIFKKNIQMVFNPIEMAHFVAIFYSVSNIGAVLISLIGIRILLKYFGFATIFAVPIVYLIIFSAATMIHPTLWVITALAAGKLLLYYNFYYIGRELVINALPQNASLKALWRLRAFAGCFAMTVASLILMLMPHWSIRELAMGVLVISIAILFILFYFSPAYLQAIQNKISLKRFLKVDLDKYSKKDLSYLINHALISQQKNIKYLGFSLLPLIDDDLVSSELIKKQSYSEDYYVRLEVLKILRGQSIALEFIIEWLEREKEPSVIAEILRLLYSKKYSNIFDLAQQYKNYPDLNVRMAALLIIYKLGNPSQQSEVINQWQIWYQSSDSFERLQAARLLEVIQIPNDIELGKKLINDTDLTVRHAATQSAAKRDWKELSSIILSNILQGHITNVTYATLKAFAKLFLEAIKNMQNNLNITKDPRVVRRAVKLLCQINDFPSKFYLLSWAKETLSFPMVRTIIALNAAYTSITHPFPPETREIRHFLVLQEIQYMVSLQNLLRNKTISLCVIREIKNRYFLAKLRAVSWLASGSHARLVLTMSQRLQSHDINQQAQALEWLHASIPDKNLAEKLIPCLQEQDIIETEEPTSLPNDVFLKNIIYYSQQKNMETTKNIPFEIIFVLRETALFNKLPVEILMLIAEEIQIIEMTKDQIIFKENDQPDGLYIIMFGSVGVWRNDHKINTLSEKQFFGEMALLDNAPRSASIIAESDGTLLFLNKVIFEQITNDVPEVLRVVVQVILGYLRTSMKKNQKL